MLRSYLRLVLFTLGLLVGVQVPGFVDDYAKRVEAHRLEAERALTGFRETAKRFFDGNLDALVAHYRQSDDPVMRSDADSVATLVNRDALLQREWQAMQGAWYARTWHVLSAADRELLLEAANAYSYQVLLVPEAIGWGLACAFLLAWLLESLALGLGRLAGVGRARKVQQRHWR
ncbi:DUF2937 family protein [Metapseudomonas otitidis]|uniref:DUF2937 family protein n=1 Tax=Metapseudomonas otitidis TaxID=319939 RepID=UPI0013F63C72|nr:DUF2937 family protein [Pseudomonas otitidis]